MLKKMMFLLFVASFSGQALADADSVKDKAEALLSESSEVVSDTASEVGSTVSEAAGKLSEEAAEAAGQFGEKASETMGDVGEDLKQFGSKLWSAGENAAAVAKDELKNAKEYLEKKAEERQQQGEEQQQQEEEKTSSAVAI